jgi:hypothetical protein
VILDVGPGVGALVLHTPAAACGQEIEISPRDAADARRTHSQVRERRTAGGAAYAAVYSGLAAGDYTIWRDASTPAGVVTISGGSVTSHQWPDGDAVSFTSRSSTRTTPCAADRHCPDRHISGMIVVFRRISRKWRRLDRECYGSQETLGRR